IRLRRLIIIAMLSGIATVLMKLNFPLPFFPPFLKMHFGDVPVVVALLAPGPWSAIPVEFLYTFFFLISTGSFTGVPLRVIANFVTGLLFLLPIHFIYRAVRSKKGLIGGLIAGTLTMAIGMTVLNYYVFLPMYTYFLGMEAYQGEQLIQFLVAGILP